jgi:uncharacterized membrane protein YbaN (DUF454 family)
MSKSHLIRYLLLIAGTLSVAAGIIGIFLPVLPTTPFLLLAAFCYIRSSRRMYNLLLNNRLCGSFLRNYLEGRGITVKQKVLSLSLLWMVLGVTMAWATDSLILRLVLAAVGTGVTIHLLMIKTRSKNVSAAQSVVKPESES